MKIAVSRVEHFNAAHRLFNAEWSDEKNDLVFGKCNNPNYHGHNYELRVTLAGRLNSETGFVMDIKQLSDLIREYVIKKLDHKNLNEDIYEFKGLNPTAENIVMVIYGILRPLIDKNLDLKLTLYETKRNYVEYPV